MKRRLDEYDWICSGQLYIQERKAECCAVAQKWFLDFYYLLSYRLWKGMVILFVLTALIFLGISHINTMAKESSESRQPYYSSILIQPGDTLWGIAREYHRDADMTMEEYREVLKQINGLKHDTIHAGRYLTVMSY